MFLKFLDCSCFVIRNLVAGLFFLFSAISWGNEPVQAFIKSLSSEQRTILDEFLQNIVKDKSGGYVFYGDKPICIEGYYLYPDSGAVTGMGDSSLMVKGIEFWQDLQVDPLNKEFLFLIIDPPGLGYRHLICINRKAFLQAVNENLTLFRHALGPNLTAESLLNKLIESKDRFYQVLKNDNVLLGILLGYGTQNSLIVARDEYISDAFFTDRKENFPFVSKLMRIKMRSWPNIQEKRPSIGYTSLFEETEALEKLTVVSRNLRPFDSCKIPFFGCMPDSEETKILLTTYETNRSEIVKALDGNFLEETLSKLFITTSKTLEIPSVPQQKVISLPQNKDEITKRFAEIVYAEIKNERHFDPSIVQSFVKGIADREKNKKDLLPNSFKQSWALYELGKELDAQENLMKSNAYFNKLKNLEGLVCVIPDKLYNKTLKAGNGPPLSVKVKNITLHYSFHILGKDRSFDDHGTIKEENLEYLVPGVAFSLIGMRKGEWKKLYIHPDYGYGEDTYLPPNVTIVAKIELLNFEEAENNAKISPCFSPKLRNYKELLATYRQLNQDFFYASGFHFWNDIKKSDLFDYDAFINYFGGPTSTAFENEDQKNCFINDLHWVLMGHLEFFSLVEPQIAINRRGITGPP